MNTQVKIKNFRVFDENGVSVTLSPITILTGCNSSGKSSLTRALLLIQDFCSQVRSDLEGGNGLHLERYKLNFHKKPHHLLGNFNNVLHRGAESEGSKRIVFEFEVMSFLLLQYVTVRMEFAALNEDELNDGYLHYVSIKSQDGKILYESTRGGNTSLDFSSVKEDLLRFIDAQRACSEWQNEETRCSANDFEIEDDNTELQNINKVKKSLGDAYTIAVVWQVLHGAGGAYDHRVSIAPTIINLRMDDDTPMGTRSSDLGVFCYFPCMEIFKDSKKEEVLKEVTNRVLPHVDTIGQDIVNVFLTAFEASEANTLHEFVSQKENEELFTYEKLHSFNRTAFPLLEYSLMRRINRSPYGAKEAYLHVVLSAMDIIDRIIRSKVEGVDFGRFGRMNFRLYNSHFISMDYNDDVDYKCQDELGKALNGVIKEIFSSLFSSYLSYLPAEILYRRRLYSLEEGHEIEKLLERFFEARKKWTGSYGLLGEKEYVTGTFLNKWLRKFGIADRCEISQQAEGMGITVRLHSDENDKEGMSLADKGLGVLQLFVILLNTETTILEKLLLEKRYDPNTSGFGTNNINEKKEWKDSLRKYDSRVQTTIVLEEPEVHLHPKYQSLLADMFVEAYQKYNIHFIIETHSEYLIRKLQVMVADKETSLAPDDVSLNYVEKDKTGVSTNRKIEILEDGRLSENFGSGFYDEAGSLALKLSQHKIEKESTEELNWNVL